MSFVPDRQQAWKIHHIDRKCPTIRFKKKKKKGAYLLLFFGDTELGNIRPTRMNDLSALMSCELVA